MQCLSETKDEAHTPPDGLVYTTNMVPIGFSQGPTNPCYDSRTEQPLVLVRFSTHIIYNDLFFLVYTRAV